MLFLFKVFIVLLLLLQWADARYQLTIIIVIVIILLIKERPRFLSRIINIFLCYYVPHHDRSCSKSTHYKAIQMLIFFLIIKRAPQRIVGGAHHVNVWRALGFWSDFRYALLMLWKDKGASCLLQLRQGGRHV